MSSLISGLLIFFFIAYRIKKYLCDTEKSDAPIIKVASFRGDFKSSLPSHQLYHSDWSKWYFPGTENEKEIYVCPQCLAVHEIIFDHGDVWLCNCGAYSQRYGNSLTVYTEKRIPKIKEKIIQGNGNPYILSAKSFQNSHLPHEFIGIRIKLKSNND